MQKKSGKSICFFSGKGGVGKTSIALNLAGIYEVIEKKVLIMDLDLFSGGITLALNRPYEKTIYNFVDDYMNKRYCEFQDYVTKYDEYIDLLSCPKDPRQASKIDSKYLEIAIDKAKKYYDVILIDTNHLLDEKNLVLLDKVDTILFILNNDPYDIKNLKNIFAIFRDLEKTNYKVLLNESRDPFKKYFTLFDIRTLLKTNIEYYLSNEFYIKNMDDYVMNGQIVTLQPKAASVFNKDFTALMRVATDLIKEKRDKDE